MFIIWSGTKINWTKVFIIFDFLPDKSIMSDLLNNPIVSLLSTPATLKLYTLPNDNSIIVNIVIFPLVLAILSSAVSLTVSIMYLLTQTESLGGGDQVTWTWLLSSTTADNPVGEPSWSRTDIKNKYIAKIILMIATYFLQLMFPYHCSLQYLLNNIY